MTDTKPPIAQVRENKDGSWYVAVIWSSGVTEQVNGFKTEREAKEWARTQLQTWLEGRKARGDNTSPI